MDVLISVDMEGIAGIATVQQVLPKGRDYQSGRILMTGEANAAAAGAFEAGASSVVIVDSHGAMDNLIGDRLDPRVDYVIGSPGPLDMIQELTPDTDVVLLVGYHAGAGDAHGVLAHSYDGAGFVDVRLNGHSVTESELNGLVAAADGVPVGLVTGDNVTCATAEKLFPGVVTVPVKSALGNSAARSRHPKAACEAIAAGAARAVTAVRDGELTPVTVPGTLHVEADLHHLGAVEIAARLPGTTRSGHGTVGYRAASPREAVDVLTIWSVLANHGFIR